MAKILIILLCVLEAFNAVPLSKDIDVLSEDYNYIENALDEDDTIDISHLGPKAFGKPSNKTGEAVSQWSEASLVNPEELGEYAEGDILMPKPLARNGIRHEAYRWPFGIIPYSIDGYFNMYEMAMIREAIADFHRLTCLRFVPYTGQRDYISIQSGRTGCWSRLGRIGGGQPVNLQTPGCVTNKGTVIHELLHAVGFFHEQNRPERDNYVKINYNNILEEEKHNFQKLDYEVTNDFGVTYDYNSVMHYSEYAFSNNGEKTIEPKKKGVTVGQREGFSRGDIIKVNNMYKCNKGKPRATYNRKPEGTKVHKVQPLVWSARNILF